MRRIFNKSVFIREIRVQISISLFQYIKHDQEGEQ